MLALEIGVGVCAFLTLVVLWKRCFRRGPTTMRRRSVSLVRAETPRRKKFRLGASSVAQAMGVHPYGTREQLYSEIVDGKVEERSSQQLLAMAQGVAKEKTALNVYDTLRLDGACVQPGEGHMVYCDTVPWVVGYVDGFIYDAGGSLEGILEIKTRAPLNPNTIAVPYQRISDMYYHIPQCLVYMESTGAQYCDLMSFTPRGSTIFRLRFDAQLFSRCVALLQCFRACVLSKNPPLSNDGWQQERDNIKELLQNYPWEPVEHF